MANKKIAQAKNTQKSAGKAGNKAKPKSYGTEAIKRKAR